MSRTLIIYLSLFVFGPVLGEQMAARLNGSKRWDSGLLEIFYKGTWNTVCDDSFDDKAAQVACRMIGCNNCVATKALSNGASSENILIKDLDCRGNETSLTECMHGGLDKHRCNSWDFVGVTCNPRPLLVIQPNKTVYPLMEGTSAVLECVVSNTSYDITDYKWPESAGGRREGKYLIISNVTRSLNRRPVKCEATTKAHTTFSISSDVLELQVFYPPDESPVIGAVPPLLSGQPVYQGDNFTLTCTVRGGQPVNYTIVTFVCPEKVDEADTVGGSEVNSSLRFYSVSHDNQGNCTCSAVWKDITWYTKTADYTLIVYTPPSPPEIILMTNTSGGIEQVGANFTLKCESLQSGHPAAYYTWPENAGGRPDGDLLIFDKLTKEQNGRNVTCVANNEFTVNRQPVPKATLTLHVHAIDPKNSHGMQSASSIFIAVVCSLVIVAAIIFISAFIWKRSRGHSISYRFVNHKASGPYIENMI